jgi:hypothetical protein
MIRAAALTRVKIVLAALLLLSAASYGQNFGCSGPLALEPEHYMRIENNQYLYAGSAAASGLRMTVFSASAGTLNQAGPLPEATFNSRFLANRTTSTYSAVVQKAGDSMIFRGDRFSRIVFVGRSQAGPRPTVRFMICPRF